MKKRTPKPLLCKFMLPAFLLILLPILTGLLFQVMAVRESEKVAAGYIQDMNVSVQAILTESLKKNDPAKGSEESDRQEGPPEEAGSHKTDQHQHTGNPHGPHDPGGDSPSPEEVPSAGPEAPPEQNSSNPEGSPDSDSYTKSDEPDATSVFLHNLRRYAAGKENEAKLLVLSPEYGLIFPADPYQAEIRTELAAEFSEAIQKGAFPENGSFTSSDGTAYLVSLTKPREPLTGVGFIISYYSIDYLIGWTHKAAILVLITTALFTLLAQAGIWRSARQISASLETLNSGSRRIGTGDFSPIEPASDIQEFDDLRTAMNDMSASLLHLRSSRDEMILQVSHKLRNRLMAIDGYAQEIAAGARSDSSGLGRSIQAESARLMDELDKLMTFTRVEDPDVLIPLETVPLTEILQNSLDRFSAMGMKKGLSVRLTAGPSEIWVQGNEYLLENILDNLLSNAVRHAEKEILLSIRSEGHLVRLKVMDDGSGIREEDLPHLFERFYKGANGRFGMGLPIALAAARKMDADLTAANRLEGGAVFTLTLKSSEVYSS